ncbi:MAG TPA: hypothetical protein VJT16_06720 [Streptosporangiaceae bacterium]|nr:hypothetical protein [Streptosporangiaceae bacterium]
MTDEPPVARHRFCRDFHGERAIRSRYEDEVTVAARPYAAREPAVSGQILPTVRLTGRQGWLTGVGGVAQIDSSSPEVPRAPVSRLAVPTAAVDDGNRRVLG